MNRVILIAALMIISLPGKLFAQNDNDKSWYEKLMSKSKTERTFTMDDNLSNIRDFVRLRDGEMMLELNNVDDFDRLKHLDSILLLFRKDIAFYKDSLDNYPGNVRIDYVLQTDHDYREIRFKRYNPDGDMYVNTAGEISRLKVEEDTIRIIMHVKGKEIYTRLLGEKGKEKIKFSPQYTIQIAFWLNNYTDIDKVIADKDMLRHSIDTLQSTKGRKTVLKPYDYPSSSIYYPYTYGRPRFINYNGILKSENTYPFNFSNRKNKLTLGLNIGAGLVRNTIAPMGEIGLSYYDRRAFRNDDYYTFINVSMTPYFLFDRSNDGQFFIKDNWFANFEIGSPGDILGIKTKLLTGGLGYLVVSKGDYFKGTTLKAFLNIKLRVAFTISPELIFTNDFKQIFPGITFKIF